MKLILGAFLIILLFSIGFSIANPLANAQTTRTITISLGAGSGGPSGQCVITNSCFDPKVMNISPDDTISWKNNDNVVHTVTSGHLTDAQTGTLFDDSILPGNMASVTFRDSGTVDYFCKIHPWLMGRVVVGTSVDMGRVRLDNMGIISVGKQPIMTIAGTVSDASTQVTVTATPPTSGNQMTIILNFKDAHGDLIKNQNYDVTAKQDGNYVLSISNGHTNTGDDTQVTSKLRSSNPVDVEIMLNGVGLTGTDQSTWTGPKNNLVYFHIIPEFGSIIGMIIIISLIGPIIISRRYFRF